MFLDENELKIQINRIFSESRTVDCAVAFVGDRVRDTVNGRADIRLVCNLESGATNPNAISRLMRHGVRVKTNPKLHSKVYIGDEAAVISSANLSANGLGLEGDDLSDWIESGFLVEDRDQLRTVRDWFETLWRQSGDRLRFEHQIESYVTVWENLRKRRSEEERPPSTSLLEVLTKHPEYLSGVSIYFALYTRDYFSDEASECLHNLRASHYGSDVDAYEAWDDLPEDAYLLDFYIAPRNGVEFNGIFKTPKEKIIVHNDDTGGYGGNLFLCYEKETIRNCTFTQEDVRRLKPFILEMLNTETIGRGDSEAKVVSVWEAAKFLKKC